MIPSWNGDGVNTGLSPNTTGTEVITKTNIGLAIGTTIAPLGIALTTVPKAKAGGIYWNNNGGGAVVVNRSYYYGGRGVVAGPNGACARGYYGRGGCVRY